MIGLNVLVQRSASLIADGQRRVQVSLGDKGNIFPITVLYCGRLQPLITPRAAEHVPACVLTGQRTTIPLLLRRPVNSFRSSNQMVNGMHLHSTFLTSGHSKCFTIFTQHSPIHAHTIHTTTVESATQGDSQLVGSSQGEASRLGTPRHSARRRCNTTC